MICRSAFMKGRFAPAGTGAALMVIKTRFLFSIAKIALCAGGVGIALINHSKYYQYAFLPFRFLCVRFTGKPCAVNTFGAGSHVHIFQWSLVAVFVFLSNALLTSIREGGDQARQTARGILALWWSFLTLGFVFFHTLVAGWTLWLDMIQLILSVLVFLTTAGLQREWKEALRFSQVLQWPSAIWRTWTILLVCTIPSLCLQTHYYRHAVDLFVATANKNDYRVPAIDFAGFDAIDLPPHAIDLNRNYGPGLEDSLHIVGFIDMNCPSCMQALEDLLQLPPGLQTRIRTSIIHFPISSECNPAGIPASQSESCRFAKSMISADMQKEGRGRTLLLERIGNPNVGYSQVFKDHPKLDHGPSDSILNMHVALGNQMGVVSTPSFFINGRKAEKLHRHPGLNSLLLSIMASCHSHNRKKFP